MALKTNDRVPIPTGSPTLWDVFASAALQGILSQRGPDPYDAEYVDIACRYADEMLARRDERR